MRKALEILLENAVNTTENGSVQLTVSHPDNEYLELAGFSINPNLQDKAYLLVTIADTSAGMQEADLTNIFDPYVNIDKFIAKKAVAKSMEMGIVYNLIRILKGKIWAESELMKGTSFSFIIPIERLSL